MDYDALVIGGGPAGCCAAALCRQRGLSVCLVEKEPGPQFKIGESLLPMGNAILREMGVWEKVEQAGFIRKNGARFRSAEGNLEKRISFRDGLIPGLEYTYQVERQRFDKLLLDHVRDMGVTVRFNTRVASLAESEVDVRCILSSDSPEPDQPITARWVFNAGGRESLHTLKGDHAFDPPPCPRRVAVFNHFRGMQRATGPEAGDTIAVRLKDGWFWIIPIDASRTSVGLVMDVEAFRRRKGTPREIFEQTVEAFPILREPMAQATPCMEFHVKSDYSFFRKHLASGRVVHVGDSAGFIDPVFSSGVYVALWSAKLAVDTIDRVRRDKPLSRAEQRNYTRRVKNHAQVFLKLINTFYDDRKFSLFMVERPPFDLERGINSIVAGHARMTPPLWWRFNLFNLLCSLQKRISLAPSA